MKLKPFHNKFEILSELDTSSVITILREDVSTSIDNKKPQLKLLLDKIENEQTQDISEIDLTEFTIIRKPKPEDELDANSPITIIREGMQIVKGLNGRDGKDGKDGKDGRDGKDGKDGKDGERGIQGLAGRNGEDGKDGKDGRDGLDGKDGRDGLDGKDGKIPLHQYMKGQLRFESAQGQWGEWINLKKLVHNVAQTSSDALLGGGGGSTLDVIVGENTYRPKFLNIDTSSLIASNTNEVLTIGVNPDYVGNSVGGKYVFEYFKVAVDGEDIFDLSYQIIPKSETVILNGLVLTEGIDYTVGTTIPSFIGILPSVNIKKDWNLTIKYAVQQQYTFDTFSVSASEFEYTLSYSPINNTEVVVLNGLVLTEGIDYALTNNLLSLNNQIPLQDGWTLTVKYTF